MSYKSRDELLPPIKATDPRDYGACWSDEGLTAAFAGRAEVTVHELCTASEIQDRDKVWLLTAHSTRHDRTMCVEFAKMCADYAATFAASAASAAYSADSATCAAAYAAAHRQPRAAGYAYAAAHYAAAYADAAAYAYFVGWWLS